MALPWHRPSIGEEEIGEVVDTLRSGWLTSGPKVERFEHAVCEFVGAESAFATTSATAALHLALLAAGIGPGDEVITTGMTFCATINVVEQVGAVPVLVDCEPDTLNLDPVRVGAAVTDRTRALIVVHFGGHPADMAALGDIARQHSLVMIEDAAHAIGARYRSTPVGGLGNLTAFSFYANKNITTGEGGMLVGGRDMVARARLLGRHGVDRPVWDRAGSRGRGAYDVTAPGLKYNMSDLQAALGIHQLRRLPGFVERRAKFAELYARELAGLPGLRLPVARQDVDHAWHLYPVRVLPEATLTRDGLAAQLASRGIGTSVHFQPIPDLTYYRGVRRHDRLTATHTAGAELLSLPCFPAMTEEDVANVVAAVREALS